MQFTARVSEDSKRRIFVPVPFDPDKEWPARQVHHVTGTVSGHGVRGRIERFDGEPGMVLGPAWRRDCHIANGDEVVVTLAPVAPEGPQRDDLAPDLAAVLAARPAAGGFFDSLPQFYRRAYLNWINATKHSPEKRALRIAEVVDLLRAMQKERPR